LEYTNETIIHRFKKTDVEAPAVTLPNNENFFSKADPAKPDLEFLKTHFSREGRLTEEQALFIINKGTELLKKESNLLEIDAPITGERGELLLL
jgi:serine/threonine-protein phosphatase 2B catalytic subunit